MLINNKSVNQKAIYFIFSEINLKSGFYKEGIETREYVETFELTP